jgi:predicted dehydrogenase
MIHHAIVGCGRVAENHADAFSLLQDVQIKYAVDIIGQKAQALAEKFGISLSATSLERILDDPELDTVSLAVPHYLHGPMAIQAAQAGKHVLIEKPLVTSLADGKKLMEMAAHSDLVISPVAQHRFDRIVCEIKALMDSGEMGSIRLARGHLECYRPPGYYSDSDWRGLWEKEGGSVLINQAYHIVDLLLHIGGPVSEVSATMNTFQKDIMETEDTLCAWLRFRNHAVGSISICGSGGSSWSSYIEFICEKGLVAFDINFPNQLHRFEMASKKGMKYWRDRLRGALPDPGTLSPGIGYYGISHRDQAADFIAAVKKEKPTSGASLEQALDVVEVINNIYDSAKRQQK